MRQESLTPREGTEMGYTEPGLWQDDAEAERDERIGDHEFYATVYDLANGRYMGNHVPWRESLGVFLKHMSDPKWLHDLLKVRFRVVARCHCDWDAAVRHEVVWSSSDGIDYDATERAALATWRAHVEAERAALDTRHAAEAKRRANGWLVGIDQLTALDPMEQFGAIRTARAALDAVEVEAVVAARRAGRSWTEVGMQLGMAKQSAHERFAKYIDPQGAEAA